MRSMSTQGLMVVCVAVIVALVVGLPSAPASQKTKEPAAAKPEAPKSTAERREAKKPVAADEATPRMPAHFNKVINEEQRPKIIAVLKDHGPKIQQLRAELASLIEKRDEALLKVLTPTQRRQLEELRAEASAKRAAASADGEKAEQPKHARPSSSRGPRTP